MAVGLLVTTFLANGLMACAQGKSADPWTEARLASRFEHDLAKAATIYRRIAQEATNGNQPDVRTKAMLELAKVLRRAGMMKEATAALSDAAGGQGPAAKEADRLLTIGDQDPDLLKAKVDKLIQGLRSSTGDKSSYAMFDLLWIGEAAAAYLVAVVDSEKADLEFISTVSQTLFRMGGKVTERWVANAAKYPDVLKRRAVVKGLGGVGKDEAKVGGDALAVFLVDKAAAVRRDTVQSAYNIVPAHRIIRMVGDPDAEVRDAARGHIEDRFGSLKHGGRHNDNLIETIRLFELRGWELRANLEFYGAKALPQFLSAVRSKATAKRNVRLSFRKPLSPPTAEELKEIGITADALGAFPAAPRRLGSVDTAANNLGYYVARSLDFWDGKATQMVLKLIGLNYGIQHEIEFETWLIKHADISDMPAIAKVLHQTRYPHLLLGWMARHRVPAAAVPHLKSFVTWYRALDWQQHYMAIMTSNTVRSDIRIQVCRAFAASRTKDAEQYLVSLIKEEDASGKYDWYKAALSALSEKRDEQTERALCSLLVAEGDSKHARQVRTGAFETLVQLGAEQVVDLYAKAYELGLSPAPAPTPLDAIQPVEGHRRGTTGALIDLVHRHVAQSAPALLTTSYGGAQELSEKPYPASTLAKIFESCLRTRELAAYQDALYCVGVQRNLPPAVVAVIAKNALAAPSKASLWKGSPDLRTALVHVLVDHYPNASGIMELIKASTIPQTGWPMSWKILRPGPSSPTVKILPLPKR